MIELRTLGELDLFVNEQPVQSLVAHQKRLAVLIYLIVSDVTIHRRDTLLAMFWPELDESRARAALRKALHFIRRAIGDDVLVNRVDDAIAIDRTGIRCDATALRIAIAEANDPVTLRLYRGEFLAGFHLPDAPGFERWVEKERKRFGDFTLSAARRHAIELEGSGQVDEATDTLDAAHASEPFNSALVKDTIDLMTRAGHRFRAIRIYDELAQRLLDELGDRAAAITAYEEALRMREELETQLRSEKEVLNLRITSLRSQVQTA